ncbi:YfmQ family protein [Bacillus sp. EB600]|uniref:YfmQ family protein n=1 Tax=Bacillus sp. EB600 TaxID=2806345 RepID=UPI00210E6930|nr:YfmQ family protein [Bacillus sp. EB600]MCQ6279656.1 YfmQ family protein [Bacillus sp. EB600]
MTWIILLSIVITIGFIVMTSIPTSAVELLISKFEIHSKLSNTNTTVTIDGKRLEGEDKIQVIYDFNEAIFLKRHNIYQGTEELFLHPENGGTPIVIDTKRGKKDVRFFVYRYNDHVDVVKQYKRKVIAYSLRSDSLQKCSMSVTRNLV